MITQEEKDRLERIENRIREIAEEEGLVTTDIIFEIAPSETIMEGMAFYFPSNFSYWQFGRDYEKVKTIYEHTGSGIPYEQVWNFETPKALICESNPFALKVLTMAHVYGHVDFFLSNAYLKHVRSFTDIAMEARYAARQFREYEQKYGLAKVEDIMDATEAIQWHQSPDLFANEDNEELVRERLIRLEREKLSAMIENNSLFQNPPTAKEIEEAEKRIEELHEKTPPEPVYDLLLYLLRHSRALKPWMQNIISVMRNQARHLAPNMRTKLLNEGWATFWHMRIMRRLFAEELLDDKDHDVYSYFHSGVVREQRYGLNWYGVGSSLFEDIEYRWNTGRFGEEYEECADPYKRGKWDTHAMLGKEKIFDVRTHCTDRLAVEEFFTDDFIRGNRLYIYQERYDDETDSMVDEIVEDNPEIIRMILKHNMSQFGIPIVRVMDGNFNNTGDLLLSHYFKGYPFAVLQYFELTPESWRQRTLEKIYSLWHQRPVHLETFTIDYNGQDIGKEWKVTLVRYTFNGKNHISHPYRTMNFPKERIYF